MDSFQPAAIRSACDTISHRVISTNSGLDRLVKSADPTSTKSQRLLTLSGSLAQFKDSVEKLRESLSAATVVSQPVQSALNVSVMPCADASAVIEKQIHRLEPSFDIETLDTELISGHQVANARLFTVIADLLAISISNAQEERYAAVQGRQLLDRAVESTAQVLIHRDDLCPSQEESEIQPPPNYPSEASAGTKKEKKSDGFFSSLSHSFRAMTASLRPKPEPIVIAMCQSAKAGNVGHLKGFVAQGVNINGQDEDGYTPLICATRANQTEAVKFLLSAGADITAKDSHGGKRKSALFHAAECGYLALTETLMDLGADIGERSWSGQPHFIEVANSNELEIIKLFLDRGASANASSISGQTIFTHALQAGSLDHVRLLYDYGGDVNKRDLSGQPPLHIALGQNRLDIVDFLLQHGADVNASDMTGGSLLLSAVRKKNFDLAEMLLKRGANPNTSDIMGRPLLGTLVENTTQDGQTESRLTRLFLQRGADPNQTDSWGEPLVCHVMEKGNAGLLRAFLEHGANPNHMFRRNQTLLLYALEHKQLEQVRMLLKHGADPNKANSEGKTPLVEALLMNKIDLVRELLNMGADINKGGTVKPADLTQIMSNREAVSILVARGAKAPTETPAPPPPSTSGSSVQPSTSGGAAWTGATPVAHQTGLGVEDETLPAYTPQ
ncbi:related to ankyrin [Cephalotrichum gorgonifer]|uniref:Related to ankyrin n=1 Tax=Cephalotrichum gorgonifer TaxID=2041049 RepID=A0AAE8N8Z0_9PEZI|nr:related to ankyrin [Cephalotrichum gorgonifer]